MFRDSVCYSTDMETGMAIQLDDESTSTAELVMYLHGNISALDQLSELETNAIISNLIGGCQLFIDQLYRRVDGNGVLDFDVDYTPRGPDHLHAVP